MNVYIFVIKATPKPINKACSDIAGARVHIWVVSPDRESAKNRALLYLESYLWDVDIFESENEMPLEQAHKLHKDTLCNKVHQFGIAAEFLASPKIQGNPDDPVMIRSLERP